MKIFILLIALTTSVAAQVPCGLKTSPIIRGLKLGINMQSIKAIYPEVNFQNDPFIVISPDQITNPLLQKGIERIFITLSKTHVVEGISVNYDNSIEWKSSTEFTNVISESLGIRAGAWFCPPELRCNSPSVQRDLICSTFKMSVIFIDGRPRLFINRPVSEEKRRFKP